MPERKKISIYAALAANVLIAVTKFIAGSYTNSTSMISEGVHSIVDTLNELLLLYGIRRSEKKPDKIHPFGYGRELYFWSFVVSLLIFGLGGGLSVYQGILHIMHPLPLKNAGWNYIVLAVSILFEGTSFIISLKTFNKTRGDVSFWRAIIKSKDPSSFIILFEDGAAVLGLFAVLVLMRINQAFNIPILDGIASIIVGLLLVFTSTVLARESRSLLLGESISITTRNGIKAIAENDEAVVRVAAIVSNYESPDTVWMLMIVEFKNDLAMSAIVECIDRIRKEITTRFEPVEYVIIEPLTKGLVERLRMRGFDA